MRTLFILLMGVFHITIISGVDSYNSTSGVSQAELRQLSGSSVNSISQEFILQETTVDSLDFEVNHHDPLHGNSTSSIKSLYQNPLGQESPVFSIPVTDSPQPADDTLQFSAKTGVFFSDIKQLESTNSSQDSSTLDPQLRVAPPSFQTMTEQLSYINDLSSYNSEMGVSEIELKSLKMKLLDSPSLE